MLRRRRAALCLHDMLPEHPQLLTTNWVYLRYHGGDTHEGRYSAGQLQRQADVIQGHLANGVDVYAYFNNDQHGHAVRNAVELRDLVARNT